MKLTKQHHKTKTKACSPPCHARSQWYAWASLGCSWVWPESGGGSLPWQGSVLRPPQLSGSPTWACQHWGHSELGTQVCKLDTFLFGPGGVFTWQKQVWKNLCRKQRVWIVNTFSLSSYVLQELVETERDYVRDLGYVVEVCFQRCHKLYQPPESTKGYRVTV